MAETSGRQEKCIFPISRLPGKLLLVIFQAVVDDTYSLDNKLGLDYVTLAGVCRAWRSLVLSTTRFWTRLHILIGQRPGAFFRKHLERCVKRSANELVDVVLYVARPRQYNPSVNSQAIMVRNQAKLCLEILRECSYRWRSLRIIKEESHNTDLFNFVLSELGLPHAPALKMVEIICHNRQLVTFVKKSFQFLSSTYTPSLKTLTLEGCDPSILDWHFDASSLTHLSLSKCSYIPNSLAILRNLLSSARNLVSLELHQRVVGHAEMDDILCPVTLPILQTLSIMMGTEKPAYLSNILRTIAAPELHNLAVYGDSLASWKEDDLPDFSSPALFLRQDQTPKFPSVRKLTMKNILQSISGPGKSICSIFTAFPHVTEVVLDHDVREIAEQLALGSYDKKALPLWTCLRQLTIEMAPMTKFYYLPQLSEWLRLRRMRGQSLPVVVIRYELQRTEVMGDARDLTAIRRIVNDVTGYRASDRREVVKQLGKLGALVDLRVES
ncbi:hypothetical protein DEU56DRAFT_186207 [Suillus clintonianus]|uniref:uncharacterized protein n=1 Tax=Suillus clintonianus TaxID=1904413 RepID=UPI001B8869F7|nr:uncharacterized protein DEU56DRAFT_186207 [Suillus clintonianus]KAG2145890.1 hypothetical protein DEU56DRAFT_186207 [Suillus clintonianus]